MNNIWKTLKEKSVEEDRPIFALAPMEDVTDTAFRQVIAKTGKPDIFYTEFMSVEGFMSEKGRSKVAKRLIYTELETPLIAQIWGIDPTKFEQTAKELIKLGFDGIDINMGCPQKKIVKHGACSGLIGNYSLAKEIIEATKQGTRGELPVSVKTRIGKTAPITNEWISFLLETALQEITIHGRTAKEMSKVPAHWDEVGKAIALRDTISPETIILGNGDVFSYGDGVEKADESGVDGVMIGRGIFKNPWIFNPNINPSEVSLQERLDLMKLHISLYKEAWGTTKPIHNLRHYFKIYLNDFPNVSEMREKFMECESYEELEVYLDRAYRVGRMQYAPTM